MHREICIEFTNFRFSKFLILGIPNYRVAQNFYPKIAPLATPGGNIAMYDPAAQVILMEVELV